MVDLGPRRRNRVNYAHQDVEEVAPKKGKKKGGWCLWGGARAGHTCSECVGSGEWGGGGALRPCSDIMWQSSGGHGSPPRHPPCNAALTFVS